MDFPINALYLISANGEFPPVVTSTTRLPLRPTIKTTTPSIGSPFPDDCKCVTVRLVVTLNALCVCLWFLDAPVLSQQTAAHMLTYKGKLT